MPSAAGSSGGGAKGAEAPKEKRKVEMQVLHMSDDSQAKIEKALFDLYGGQHKMRDAKSYKDSGRGYVMKKGNMYYIQLFRLNLSSPFFFF